MHSVPSGIGLGGADTCRRNLTFANRPPDGICAHANEGREFLFFVFMRSPWFIVVPPYAGDPALGIRQETAYDS